jgi:hypothetical protein
MAGRADTRADRIGQDRTLIKCRAGAALHRQADYCFKLHSIGRDGICLREWEWIALAVNATQDSLLIATDGLGGGEGKTGRVDLESDNLQLLGI